MVKLLPEGALVFIPRHWGGCASWGLLGGPREVDILSCVVILV